MRMIIKDCNVKEASLQKELHYVKMQLNSTLNHNKLIREEVSMLKQDFKQKENKLLEEFLDMKQLKEKVEDKLYKQDQSLQTVHMLCKPKSFYDEINRVAIGYKNPFYLSKAKQIQPALYNGHEIVKTKHAHPLVHDSKDTLEIAKALKEKAKSAKPITTMIVYPPNTPAKLRITPTGLTEGERGFEQTKICYLTKVILFLKTIKDHFEGIQKALVNEIKEMKEVFDQMEAEVDQHAVDKKCDEIELKNLLIENENLIADCLSKDVFYTAINYVLTVSGFSNMHDAYTAAQKCIAELEVDNSNLKNKIQNDDHDEMIKHFSKLEVEHLNLQLKYQHLKEHFGNQNSVTSSDAPAFESKHSEADPILDFKALDSQNKDLNAKVNALQDLNEHFRVENKKVKQHYKELYDSIKIKGKTKCVTMPDPVKLKVLAPGTLYEILKEARVEKLLDSSLASACLYTKRSPELLEYVIGTCPKDFNKRDKKIATAPLNKKKRVTFMEPGVKDATTASGSKPRSNTKKYRTLPAKSDMKKVEAHSRNNKSSVKQNNRVDSSISLKRTVINSNSTSVYKTCNKCLMSFNHDKYVVRSLKFVKKSPVNKIWNVKQVKQVWQATRKLFTNIGFQWQPTGRKFTLEEQCPLTRTPIEIGDPMYQTLHTHLFSNAGRTDCPVGILYGRTGTQSFSVRQFFDSDLEVTFRKHSCYVRDVNGVNLIKGNRDSNLYTISVEDMMKSSPICL
ncbi:hypothetical protein Tco_0321158 [Tanacetum coccineum]